MITHSFLPLILILLHLTSSCCSFSTSEKVLLHQVDKIVLREGHMTNSRRVSAIPQLRCVGGPAGCSATPRPNLVVCSNAGRDKHDARWECEADFDNRYKFGRLQVSCEGFDYPDDPYVLKDSCGLEYEIDYDNSHSGNYGYGYSDHGSQSSFNYFNLLVFLAICLLVYGIYRNTQGAGEESDSSQPSSSTAHSSTPSAGIGSGTGGWGNFLTGMFVGGIANFVFSIISSIFRPRYGYGSRYGSGYARGYGGYSGFGGFGGRRGYSSGTGSWGGSSSGGGTSRKSGFGGTGRR